MHQGALSIGVATVANKKAIFVTLMDAIPQFDAHWSQFFTEFYWFVVIKSRLYAYISRYGDFCADDNDNNNDTTDYFTPCACTRGNEWYLAIIILHFYVLAIIYSANRQLQDLYMRNILGPS